MRMHRGSSKGAGAGRPPPEHLPLSASAPVPVEVEVARAGRAAVHVREVAPGTLVKEVVRSVGEAPEGSAVLIDGVSVPLDTPVDRPLRLVVVPTFSGG
jgi:sulfur carrier protein ThiS